MGASRKLNLWDIFCIATGAMISSGLFVLPALAYAHSGPSIIVAYFLAGILMIPSVFSKSELLTAMPKAGGTYFFIERSFGPFLGIFGGLASWFSVSLKSAFALVGIGTFLEYCFPSLTDPRIYLFIKLAAALCCVVFVLVNLFSIKLGARFQNIMVVFLLLTCIFYIIFGLRHVSLAHFRPFLPNPSGFLGLKPFFYVVGLIFVSYGGLTKVASIAEETENPSRTIPAGMVLSFLVVQVLYVACVTVTIGTLKPHVLASTLTPLTHGAIRIGGLGFGILLSLGALTAFFTTANAGILSSSRVPFAMAKDAFLPGVFSRTSAKFGTPYVSIIITGLFMLGFILFLDLENLVKTASTLMIILFMFVNLSVIIMRESKIINYRPTFRAPFYPWIQIGALLCYSFFIVKMGKIPLLISFCFVGVSFLWFIASARTIKRQSALMHLVERVTAKEFVDTTLEDELKSILHKRDNIIKDRFDHLIESCSVLDLEESVTRNDLFSLVAEILSLRLDVPEKEIFDLLIEREEQSTTVIEKGLALPHIVVEGENKFEIVMVRCKKGIKFSSSKPLVHIVFVLAGSRDERNFHLRALMAIAQIVRENNFFVNWMRMRDRESLRMLVLSSTRKRDM
jgi:amino acid transporter/mannitol/fructose-specific phosphotransferase system IIA component (Ntr-type)